MNTSLKRSAASTPEAPHNIPYVQLHRQYAEERAELAPIIEAVLAGGSYVGDALVEELERDLAAYIGAKHAIALNSGTDALILGMIACGIGPGDEVITPPNSFVASTAAIVRVGATPIFADVLPDQNMDPDAVASAITPRTKAIMPVHLTGRVCRMDALEKLAAKHNLMIIEDAAQAIGSKYNGRMSGTFGRIGCFSTHPLKNLSACGDGGFLTTNDDAVAARVKRLRNHGMTDRVTVAEWGIVSRMDTVQAAIIKFRLPRLAGITERRRANAKYYQETLRHTGLFVPPCRPEEFNTFHTFVVQTEKRDALQKHLQERGIKTTIHYPVPIHLQPAAAELGYKKGMFPVTEAQAERILTLPVNQYLAPEERAAVAQEILAFLG